MELTTSFLLNMRTAHVLWFTFRLTMAAFLCAWAIQRWHWYSTLPLRSAARWCGNCFLGTVGIPAECGVFGLFLLVHLFCPHVARAIGAKHPGWWLMMVGIVTTPFVVGVPLFVGAAVWLAASAAHAALAG